LSPFSKNTVKLSSCICDVANCILQTAGEEATQYACFTDYTGIGKYVTHRAIEED
jgi:hypothetical protein